MRRCISWLPVLLLCACPAPSVAPTCLIREGPPLERAEDLRRCYNNSWWDPDHPDSWVATLGSDADILLVVDNTPSMLPMQTALAQALPTLIRTLEEHNINYHIGVTSTDIGSQVNPGQPWGSKLLASCESYLGDDGKLQTLPCTQREGSPAFRQTCATLCPDPSYLPAMGRGYVSRVNGVSNVPPFLVDGTDLGPARALLCTTLLGENGCTLEAPLLASKRALDGHNPENEGFLRANSTLAVLYMTSQDDCSVQDARRMENDPRPLPCVEGQDEARCFQPEYRCMARGLVCDQALSSAGQKTGCRERSGSYLEPLANLRRFFSALRPRNKLTIAGLWSPKEAPFQVVQMAPEQGIFGLDRADDPQRAACVSKGGEAVGRAQVRLSQMLEDLPGSVLEGNICEPERFADTLHALATKLLEQHLIRCVPKVKRSGDVPLCRVADVDARTRLWPESNFSPCSASCCAAFAQARSPTLLDPSVQVACSAEATETCFCAVENPQFCRDGDVLGVWRKNQRPPAGTTLRVACSS